MWYLDHRDVLQGALLLCVVCVFVCLLSAAIRFIGSRLLVVIVNVIVSVIANVNGELIERTGTDVNVLEAQVQA